MQPGPLKDFMDRFKALVATKGYTHEELRDLLNATYLAHDPVSTTTVWKWRRRNSTAPSGSRLLGLQEFVRSHGRRKHDSVNPSVKRQNHKRNQSK